jgi:HAD superfamily phosphoserine phosphatase-like hydrolase
LLQSLPDNTAETVASDLEGTLSAGVAWEGMRDYLIAHDREQAYKSFFLRQMPRYALYKLRLVSQAKMKEDWILALLALFTGYEAEQMRAMGQWVVEKELWPARRRTILAELEAHREEGRRVIITSGQFEPILAEVLHKLEGFEGIGTKLHYENGRFSGQISGKLIQGPLKAEVLQPFTRNGRIYAAYGDTDQDIPMLTLSTRATAVHPGPALRRHAQAQGWRIVEETNAQFHRD